MIILTRLGGKEFLLNEEMIEIAQETPDTVITLNNGHSYIVTESIQEIIKKTIEYNRSVNVRVLRRLRKKDDDNTALT